MKRPIWKGLVVRGSCKNGEHVRALLEYLGFDPESAEYVIGSIDLELPFEGGVVSFTPGGRFFTVRAEGDEVVRRIHKALMEEAPKKYNFHSRCSILLDF